MFSHLSFFPINNAASLCPLKLFQNLDVQDPLLWLGAILVNVLVLPEGRKLLATKSQDAARSADFRCSELVIQRRGTLGRWFIGSFVPLEHRVQSSKLVNGWIIDITFAHDSGKNCNHLFYDSHQGIKDFIRTKY